MNEKRRASLSEYLKEIVLGGNDGIVTTFAVVAGFTGANSAENQLALWTVMMFGLANLFADGTSMGLGNFLSFRSEREVFQREQTKQQRLLSEQSVDEKLKTQQFLAGQGLSQEEQQKMTDVLSKYPELWLQFTMSFQSQVAPADETPAWLRGLATFIAFLIFGFVPLVPYLLIDEVESAFVWSTGAALLALLVLGWVRGLITQEPMWRAIVEVVLLGTLAGAVAFVVGAFFPA